MRYWWERATKVEMWQLEGLRSRGGGGGQHVWGSRNILVRELVPAPDTMMEQGMSNNSSNGSGTGSLMALINFLIRALANPPALVGFDWYR